MGVLRSSREFSRNYPKSAQFRGLANGRRWTLSEFARIFRSVFEMAGSKRAQSALSLNFEVLIVANRSLLNDDQNLIRRHLGEHLSPTAMPSDLDSINSRMFRQAEVQPRAIMTLITSATTNLSHLR